VLLIRIAVSVLLIVSGLLMLPLPLPFGLVLILLGLMALALDLPYICRKIRQLRERFPEISDRLKRLEPHAGRFAGEILKKTSPAKNATSSDDSCAPSTNKD
jgi:hypothetical protein